MTAAVATTCPGRQVLRGCLVAGVAVATVPLGASALGIDVVDVHHRPEPYPGGLGVQRRLVPCRAHRLPAGLGPHGGLAGDVEVDSLDLVRPGGDQVHQQPLHVIEVTGLDRERGRALIAQELAPVARKLHALLSPSRDRSTPLSGTPCARSTSRTARTESLDWAKDSAGAFPRRMTLNRTRARSGTAFTLAAPYAAPPHGRSTICMPHIQPPRPPQYRLNRAVHRRTG
jgi:hypothetical protein